MLNTVVLIGRLATDPELKYAPSGVAVTNFRLDVQRPSKDAETNCIDFVAFRHVAAFAPNYLTTGRINAIERTHSLAATGIRTAEQNGTASDYVTIGRCKLDCPIHPHLLGEGLQ